jgi:hypothetical protein
MSSGVLEMGFRWTQARDCQTQKQSFDRGEKNWRKKKLWRRIKEQ